MRKTIKFFSLFLLCSVIAIAQTSVYQFNGITYIFPSSHVSGFLVNNGSGTLVWQAGFQSGLLAYSTDGACPAGWVEHTAVRGRLLVGLPSGGTNATDVGTVLTNQENRAVGIHTHTATPTLTLTDPGHVHTVTDPGHLHGSVPQTSVRSDENGGSFLLTDADSGALGSAVTGITINSTAPGVTASATTTINNDGAVAGTPAPYLQRLLCEKS